MSNTNRNVPTMARTARVNRNKALDTIVKAEYDALVKAIRENVK